MASSDNLGEKKEHHLQQDRLGLDTIQQDSLGTADDTNIDSPDNSNQPEEDRRPSQETIKITAPFGAEIMLQSCILPVNVLCDLVKTLLQDDDYKTFLKLNGDKKNPGTQYT